MKQAHNEHSDKNELVYSFFQNVVPRCGTKWTVILFFCVCLWLCDGLPAVCSKKNWHFWEWTPGRRNVSERSRMRMKEPVWKRGTNKCIECGKNPKNSAHFMITDKQFKNFSTTCLWKYLFAPAECVEQVSIQSYPLRAVIRSHLSFFSVATISWHKNE